MEWGIAISAIAVLGVAAAIAAGALGEMSREPVRDSYRQDLPEHVLTADDVQHLRFGVQMRGYAMDQVDDVLARLSHEIADRDARLAALTADASAGGPDAAARTDATDSPDSTASGPADPGRPGRPTATAR